jgi:hypothetical protein
MPTLTENWHPSLQAARNDPLAPNFPYRAPALCFSFKRVDGCAAGTGRLPNVIRFTKSTKTALQALIRNPASWLFLIFDGFIIAWILNIPPSFFISSTRRNI